ncbi:MobF family relaxase [uncultured Pseudonocardia sp.]|uniref:MobF family relaxase n=1 Tax=uncultured Pseudonocardia sp. TaxID=211455 RepID=UPI0026188067|nr:MobF family relaxase [uncultured Pseudonocardia sp.]
MLRITAIPAGAVEYLIRGCGCQHDAPKVELERGPDVAAGHTAERAAGREKGAAAYFAAAVEQGDPQGYWFGTGMEVMGLPFASGEVADPDDVRAVFGQLRRPESTEKDPEFLGRRPPKYKDEDQRFEALKAQEKGPISPEREQQLRQQAAATDTRKGVAYYDFTFSAPKSVSVYWAALLAAGATEQAAAVAAAHDRAVEIAIAYADKHIVSTRTGWHGARVTGNESVGRFEAGRGSVWTLWRHSTSRANEPQLHTHGGMLNRTTTADGQVRALDGAAFRAYKEAIDTAYVRALEQGVSEATGARFALRPDGVAREIVGVDPQLCAEASTRRGQVAERVAELVAGYVERHGREPGGQARKAMADMATLQTRAAKTAESGPAAVTAWGAARRERMLEVVDEVAAAGYDRAELAALVDQEPGRAVTVDGPQVGADMAATGQPVAGVDRAKVMAAAIGDVQARYAVWTHGNLAAALDARLGDAHQLGVPVEQRAGVLEALTREALSVAGVVRVSAPDPVAVPGALQRADGGSVYRRANHERFATGAHLAMEDGLVGLARTPVAATVSEAELAMLEVELAAAGLSPDQVAAVVGILGSGRVGDVLVGPAGAGKSHTVSALAAAWEERTGGRVLGLATSQVATQNLAGLGLAAVNTSRFLAAFQPDPVTGQPRQRLTVGDLLVVDEAGMSSTRELHAIATLAAAAGAKVVFTGDHAQLDSVEAGGMFAHLAETVGAHELTVVHRFTAPWEREASLQLRAGEHAAVDAYADHGRLRTGTLEEMQAAATRGWLADTLAGKESLLIVGTNVHAAELSEQIREQLIELGRVSPDTLAEAGERRQEISVGDRVQARRNDYRLRVDPAIGADGRAGPAWPVTNREVYTVIGKDPATDDLLVRDQFGATAHLPKEYVAENVTLAYAVTGYAAQGLTVDSGHPIVDRDATREALYPAATRGRESNVLYLVTERAPDAHDPERIAESARERLAAVLDRSAAQQAATRVLAEGRAQAANLQTIGGLFDIAAAEQARERYQGLLGQRLAPEVAAGLADDAGMGRLLRSLRETELAGHDLDTVLDEVLTGRGLGDANSVADVLRWRVRWHAEHRDPQRVVDPRDWTTLAPAQDGPVGDYVHGLAERATARQAQLGRDTAARAPGWAVEALGAVPAVDTPERTGWEQRAGIAAAYRELRGIDDEHTSLGAAPSREQELARALWGHAVQALGRPADVTDHRALDDAVLYQQVERWERELAAAPGWVAEQLGQAYEAAHEERVAHQLATAELAALPVDDPRRGELAAERDRAGVWADWHTERAAQYETAHQARQAWAHGTREQELQARLAAEELDRRGLPTHRDLTPDPAPVQEREPATEQDVARAGVEQDVEQRIEQDVVEQDVERAVAQDVEPAPATREERQAAWRARPDRLLGEPALAEALTRAEQARDIAFAQAERLRAQVPGLAEQVAAGRGEQVAAVEARLAQLQALAGLHEGMDAAERGFGAAQREMWQIQQQGGAAARARDATPWWRPGQRERLEAEAGQYAARYEQAKADVEGWRERLAARADRLREHTGGHRANPQWAREQLDRAQAASAAERAAAQQRDEAALAALSQRVAAQHAEAEKAGGRHGEVLAEQQHRAQLEPLDRAEESGWRLDELMAQIRERQQQTRNDPSRGRGRGMDPDELDYQRRSYDHDLEHGRDHGQDHGFGMGR